MTTRAALPAGVWAIRSGAGAISAPDAGTGAGSAPDSGADAVAAPIGGSGADRWWRDSARAAGAAAWTLRLLAGNGTQQLNSTRAFAAEAPFLVVHADLALARAVGAGALIAGTRSLPWEVLARQRGELLLGAAVHDAAEIARARSCGVDFLVLSPVWETRSKSYHRPPLGVEVLAQVAAAGPQPVVALGGLNRAERVRQARAAGAHAVAVLGAALDAQLLAELVAAW